MAATSHKMLSNSQLGIVLDATIIMKSHQIYQAAPKDGTPLVKSNFMKLFESAPEEGTYYPIKGHFNYNGLETHHNTILAIIVNFEKAYKQVVYTQKYNLSHSFGDQHS